MTVALIPPPNRAGSPVEQRSNAPSWAKGFVAARRVGAPSSPGAPEAGRRRFARPAVGVSSRTRVGERREPRRSGGPGAASRRHRGAGRVTWRAAGLCWWLVPAGYWTLV